MTNLEDAKLTATISAEMASGEHLAPAAFTVPLATMSANLDGLAHFTIRYPDDKFGGPMQPGVNEILTDYWLPGMFLETGMYTFKFEATLPGKGEERDRILFAFQMSQWLEGKPGMCTLM